MLINVPPTPPKGNDGDADDDDDDGVIGYTECSLILREEITT